MTPTDPPRLDDEAIMRLLRDADQLRGWTPPPLGMTPAEIRQASYPRTGFLRRAARPMTDPRPTRRTWMATLAAGGTLAVVAALGITAAVVPTAIRPTPAATPSPPAPSVRLVANTPAPLDLPDTSEPAADILRGLAAGLKTPATTPRGQVTYIHLQEWTIDTTTDNPVTAAQVNAEDRKVWWTPNRKGFTRITYLPAQKAGQQRADHLDQLPATARTYEYRDTPGKGPGQEGISVLVPRPSADPAELAHQLAATHVGTTGPQYTVRAVAGLYRMHHLNTAQRAAVLTVLADSGLRYWGSVTDRAGRTGLAFGIDSTGASAATTRDLLIIDPTTAALLSHEEVALTTAPRVLTSAPAVVHYTLYLANRKVTTMP